VLHAGEPLERGPQVVGGERLRGAPQLVQHELEPQLGRLVLHDEQQLVVVRRVAADLLRAEQPVELQVLRVGEAVLEVGDDLLLERPGVACRVHRAPP
jgi:hypothetical protein